MSADMCIFVHRPDILQIYAYLPTYLLNLCVPVRQNKDKSNLCMMHDVLTTIEQFKVI